MTGSPARRYELDWIRVIVTINLVPFHVAWMITSVPGFSSVDKYTPMWNVLETYMRFVSPLHMFLLFLVAGTSAYLSLGRRTPGRFVVERVKRLLVPLAVFIVFLFPLLGYFWPSEIDVHSFSYLKEFWPWCLMTSLLSPISGGPNWAHMWFVAYLFIYSTALLPVLLLVRRGRLKGLVKMTGLVPGRQASLLAPAVPVVLTFALLAPIWPFFANNLYTDWGYFTYNMTAFFFGFLIARDERVYEKFAGYAWPALAAGIVLSAAKIMMESSMPAYYYPAYTPRYMVFAAVAGLNTWAWVVFTVHSARRFLSSTNRFLTYFNRISYPFYIFHLVAISVIGSFVTRLGMGVTAEFLVICALSGAASLACCELAKRTRVTRFLFGIK